MKLIVLPTGKSKQEGIPECSTKKPPSAIPNTQGDCADPNPFQDVQLIPRIQQARMGSPLAYTTGICVGIHPRRVKSASPSSWLRRGRRRPRAWRSCANLLKTSPSCVAQISRSGGGLQVCLDCGCPRLECTGWWRLSKIWSYCKTKWTRAFCTDGFRSLVLKLV